MPLFVPQDTDNFFPYSDTTQLIASANEMADANSTLSGKDRRSSFKLEKPKTEGITKEERKAMGLEYRRAARKAKKKAKSDAKKARKLNAALTRKLQKNPEKYNKNKDRNRARAIDLERRKIRSQAVRQAERLAAIHDPSGATFNVGPVTVQSNGVVISVERKKQREAKKVADKAEGNAVPINEPNSQESTQAQLPGATLAPRVSKKQLQREKMYEHRPTPPRPVMPEGISIPEGEEDWLSLWDLDDDSIEMRIVHEKRKKELARKRERVKAKAEAKIRKAAKKLKKASIPTVSLTGPRIIPDVDVTMEDTLPEHQELPQESETQEERIAMKDRKSGKSASHAQLSPEPEVKVHSGVETKKSLRIESVEQAVDHDVKKAKILRKHTEADSMLGQSPTKAKNSKKSKETTPNNVRAGNTEDPMVVQAEGDVVAEPVVDNKRKKSTHKSDADVNAEDFDEEAARKERKRLKKERKLQEQLKKAAEEVGNNVAAELTSKKRKRSKHDEQEADVPIVVENSKVSNLPHTKKVKVEKWTVSAHSNGGENWNVDALEGDAARKDKLLRLMGAGKSNGTRAASEQKKSTKEAADILHIERELERQFDVGVKMKYDGLGKRRGLGA